MQIGVKRMLRKVSIWSGVAGQRTAVAPGACGITGIYREQGCSSPVAQTHWVQHNKVYQTERQTCQRCLTSQREAATTASLFVERIFEGGIIFASVSVVPNNVLFAGVGTAVV